jgi:four helix bundle protein
LGIEVMGQYLPHEQLDVYDLAVKFAGFGEGLLGVWPASWAVHDQFDRAIESILMNMAKAARLRTTDKGIFHIECSLGSVLECAACVDVALERHLMDSQQVASAKGLLQRIARMAVGLRASWQGCVEERPAPYATDANTYFLHESLTVYQRSLEVHRELEGIWEYREVRKHHLRRVDELTTGMTLNIAEGNGRFSIIDHTRFIGIAEDTGTKLAVYLDILGGFRKSRLKAQNLSCVK